MDLNQMPFASLGSSGVHFFEFDSSKNVQDLALTAKKDLKST